MIIHSARAPFHVTLLSPSQLSIDILQNYMQRTAGPFGTHLLVSGADYHPQMKYCFQYFFYEPKDTKGMKYFTLSAKYIVYI